MKKRDVQKLRKGDWIRLKHNLGEGQLLKVIESPNNECPQGRFPMLQYKDTADGRPKLATYLIVKDTIPLWVHTKEVRS